MYDKFVITEEQMLAAIKDGPKTAKDILIHAGHTPKTSSDFDRTAFKLVGKALRDKGLLELDSGSGWDRIARYVGPVYSKRFEALLKGHTPRYVRCYDSGPDSSADRYTVVYTGRCGGGYVGMSADPYSPQGVGQHGEGLIDRDFNGWPPSVGRRNHLGTRILFNDLPVRCKQLVLTEYCMMWGLDYYTAWDYCLPRVGGSNA